MKELSWIELFVIAEALIDDIKFQSPLFELIVEAPVEKWKDLDLASVKELLMSTISETEYAELLNSLSVLAMPRFKYELFFEVNNERHLSIFYRKGNEVVNFSVTESGQFVISEIIEFQSFINNYNEMISVSEFQSNQAISVYSFDFDRYLVLNLAFYLEEMSEKIGTDQDGNEMHFTIEDLKELFTEGDASYMQDISSIYKDTPEDNGQIDFEKTVQELIDESYLTKVDGNNLKLGSKSLFLYHNMYLLNTIKLSFINTKFIDDEGDWNIKTGTFVAGKTSVFYLHIQDRRILIEVIASKTKCLQKLHQSFDY